MRRRVHIVVAEPSPIIRNGLISVLESLESLNIDIAEVVEIDHLRDVVNDGSVDVVMVDPCNIGVANRPKRMVDGDRSVKFVAIQSSVVDAERLSNYDAVVSICDSIATIEDTLAKVVNDADSVDVELTQREIDIVVAIAKGLSNKEIAERLFISTYTVMTHRRNISAKLNIHSPAGLTIYAIVNKLIDIKDVQG